MIEGIVQTNSSSVALFYVWEYI